MNQMLETIVGIVIGYALGAVPSGYLLLRYIKKVDLTQVGSGRTGGTNTMRAGGLWMGLIVSVLDILKGYLAVTVAQKIAPENIWAHVLAGAFSVFGHNWSLWLFLLAGKISAGAGTGPNIGAATAFWFWVLPIMAPIVAFFVFVVGYASVASTVAALGIPIIFFIRYLIYGEPLGYVLFGVITTAFVAWALRSNYQKLFNGTERRVGVFARKKEEK